MSVPLTVAAVLLSKVAQELSVAAATTPPSSTRTRRFTACDANRPRPRSELRGDGRLGRRAQFAEQLHQRLRRVDATLDRDHELVLVGLVDAVANQSLEPQFLAHLQRDRREPGLVGDDLDV